MVLTLLILNMLQTKIILLQGHWDLNEYQLNYFINHLIKIFLKYVDGMFSFY
jgi:hypothetical protein